MGLGACGPGAGEHGETVVTLSPPTWFEDGWSVFDVLPGERRAVFGARFGLRLVDLPAGRRDTVMYPSRRAILEAATGLDLNALPGNAEPRVAADAARVVYFVPGGSSVFAGPPEAPRRYEFAGVVTGAAWGGVDVEDLVYVMTTDADGSGSLARITLEAGTIQTLREHLDAPNRFNAIGVSPEGRYLYLALASDAPPDDAARHRPGADRDTDIYQFDLRDDRLRPFIVAPGDDFYPAVVGDHLYWTHNDLRDQVAVVPAAGGDARVVVEDAEIPYWSHDGARIAFTHGGWRIADWALNLDAAVVRVNAEAQRISEPEPIVVGYHEDFTPAWSPDGGWIAYHSHRTSSPVPGYASPGSTDDLYLRRPDAPTGEEIRLTDFGWEVGMADWAPDGRRLVFDSWERGGTPGVSKPWIVTIDPASGRPLRVAPLPAPRGFRGALLEAWSPVRDEIAVVERIEGERQALWILRPDGGAARKLLEFRASTYGGVDWTPDGERLIFAALAGETMQLFAVPRAVGGARAPPLQLTRDSLSLIHPQVSPDGRWIAATRMYRGKELRRVRLQ